MPAPPSRSRKIIGSAPYRSPHLYEFFSLRDGIDDGNWQNGFGLLHDDYTPKPAYDAVQQLVGAPRNVHRRSSETADLGGGNSLRLFAH